jgi:quinoprotein glucose dehydrogenase
VVSKLEGPLAVLHLPSVSGGTNWPAGEAGFFTTPNGQRGAMLRAYDKATGREVGAVYMPAPQSGSPMTYMLSGQQYIVVAISGGTYSGELLAFRLPR